MVQNVVAGEGRFAAMIQHLADILSEAALSRRLSATDAASAISTPSGQPINCYPGLPWGRCEPWAVFLGLHGHPGVTPRGHLNADGALRRFVQHMQGWCPNTEAAGVLIYNWDEAAWNEWMANVRLVATRAEVEIYGWTAGQLSRLPIS